jgi:pilus assembly protein CpaC
MHRTNHVPSNQLTSNHGLCVASREPCPEQTAAAAIRKSRRTSGLWRLLLAGGLSALLAVGSASAQERVQPPTPAPGDAGVRPNVIIVPIGGTRPLQMKGKKIITRADNINERVLEVRSVRDQPDTLLLLGKDAGTTRLTLIAQDGTTEVFEIIVQLDIDYLKSILQRAVPTANINLIPIHSSTVIISGTVNHVEDIQTVLATASAVLGGGAGPAGAGSDRVINRLTVAGVQQVQLDAVIAFVDRSLTRQMGVDFFTAGAHHSFASTVSQFLLPGSITTSVGTGAAGIITAGNPNLTLSLMNNEESVDVAMKALKNEGLTKILAQPSVVTLSGRSATLLSGGQQAIPQSGGLGTTTVTFQDFGTTLSILPIVMGTGKIHLEIEPEVSQLSAIGAVTANGVTVQGRITQRVHTSVEMEPGQTLVIGGLIQNSVIATTSMVPVLGEIPFLGTLFSIKSFQEDEQELVVLVTPHLVDPQSCDQVVKLLPGQETRSPDDFELFLEQILEAPRGPREVCPNNHYVPAYKNGPTAQLFPCAEDSTPRCAGYRCGARGGVGDCQNPGYHVEGAGGAEVKGAAASTGHGADLLPPTDATEAPAGQAPSPNGKPAALPSVFAPTSAGGGKW